MVFFSKAAEDWAIYFNISLIGQNVIIAVIYQVDRLVAKAEND